MSATSRGCCAQMDPYGAEMLAPEPTAPWNFAVPLAPLGWQGGADTMRMELEMKMPRMELQLPAIAVPEFPQCQCQCRCRGQGQLDEKRPEQVKTRTEVTRLSGVFDCARGMEPVYFQSFDCVGVPDFFSARECHRIVEHAESQGFSIQRRHRLMNLQWADIIDPFFAKAMWHDCGLDNFFRSVVIDGLVASGVNDVVRIYKYVPGCVFGRHTDQHVKRRDGQVSKYSLRVYLNGKEGGFEGGLSAFHVPFRREPVVIEPEQGLALLHPQGDLCMQQEELELLEGCKYVLRADILFKRPQVLLEPHGP